MWQWDGGILSGPEAFLMSIDFISGFEFEFCNTWVIMEITYDSICYRFIVIKELFTRFKFVGLTHKIVQQYFCGDL